MFIFSIIVTSNCSCTNICVFPNFSISNISQMPCFHTFFKRSIFYFHKVSNMYSFFQMCFWTQMCKRSHSYSFLKSRLLNNRSLYFHIISNYRIFNSCISQNFAVFSDFCISLNCNIWINYSILSNFNIIFNISCIWINQNYTTIHKFDIFSIS